MPEKEKLKEEALELSERIYQSAKSCSSWNSSGWSCIDCVYRKRNSLEIDNPHKLMLCSAHREDDAVQLSMVIKEYFKN